MPSLVTWDKWTWDIFAFRRRARIGSLLSWQPVGKQQGPQKCQAPTGSVIRLPGECPRSTRSQTNSNSCSCHKAPCPGLTQGNERGSSNTSRGGTPVTGPWVAGSAYESRWGQTSVHMHYPEKCEHVCCRICCFVTIAK